MINFKKGIANSLAQVDKLGKVTAGANVISGMVVSLDSNGFVIKGLLAGALGGFAANDQTDGDVIESGKIGVLLLDGNSVIETDQTGAVAITAANFAVGAAIYADATTPGQVTTTVGSNVKIGVIEGVRQLQGVAQPTYSYKNLSGLTVNVSANTNGIKIQNGPGANFNNGATNNVGWVVGIKLLAA